MKFKIINKDLIQVYKNNKNVATVYRLVDDMPVCEHKSGVELEMREWYLIHDTAQNFFAENEVN